MGKLVGSFKLAAIQSGLGGQLDSMQSFVSVYGGGCQSNLMTNPDIQIGCPYVLMCNICCATSHVQHHVQHHLVPHNAWLIVTGRHLWMHLPGERTACVDLHPIPSLECDILRGPPFLLLPTQASMSSSKSDSSPPYSPIRHCPLRTSFRSLWAPSRPRPMQQEAQSPPGSRWMPQTT